MRVQSPYSLFSRGGSQILFQEYLITRAELFEAWLELTKWNQKHIGCHDIYPGLALTMLYTTQSRAKVNSRTKADISPVY